MFGFSEETRPNGLSSALTVLSIKLNATPILLLVRNTLFTQDSLAWSNICDGRTPLAPRKLYEVKKSDRLGRQRGNNCIDNHSLLPLS